MKITVRIFAFLLLALVYFPLTAQDTLAPKANLLETGNLNQQFDYVIKKSNKYQDYKVIKVSWMNQLKSHVSDSLNKVKKELNTAEATIKTQKQELVTFENKLKEVNAQVEQLKQEKDNVTFIGAPTSKGAYKTIMWSIVGVLSVLLAFFIFKFKRAHVVTSEAQTSLRENQIEFEEYRKKAREKEQKLKRELQDELNKQL